MTILSVAYPLMPVGPDSAGGAEQILFLIERELVNAGHQSIVVAAKGSQASGEILETPVFAGEITEEVRTNARRAHLLSLNCALDRYSIDLIHFHGLDFHAYQPAKKLPKLATLHLPPSWYPASVFGSPDVQLNCVSEFQAGAAPGNLPFISNGIDTDQFQLGPRQRNGLLWLGRICPEKGVHLALQVARRLDLPLVIAGPVHPFRDHRIYFSQHVQPLLDAKRKYVGPVAFERKKELLAQPRCLLIPSLVPETSSLVAMEALCSGTPVVALRSGALPGIVEHGETGFIVESEDAMADAVTRGIPAISPETCRAQAKLRFDGRRMASEYMDLYSRLIANGPVEKT